MSVVARYFDGQRSQPQQVWLSVQAGCLRLADEGGAVLGLHAVGAREIAERLGGGPRLIRLPAGGLCEVADHAAFDQLLAELGVREQGVALWQTRWLVAMAATLLLALAAFSAYRWGLPLFADYTARYIPPAWAQQSDRQALLLLDRSWLAPSALPESSRQRLRSEFASLSQPAGSKAHWTLEFRAAPAIGANAFALPGGTIVMTDELVRLAGNDQEILAVLAHELGHVRHRHGLRMALQGTLVGLVVTAWLGDASAAIAGASAALLETRYSREFEREADAFGAQMLKANRLSPILLATMLQKLGSQHKAEASQMHVPELLSSHPPATERIATLQAAAQGR